MSRRASSAPCRPTRICRTSSPFSASTNFREEQKLTVSRARKVQRFLSQPFHVAEQFTGFPGKYVKVEDTVRSFKEIIDGKHDAIPGAGLLHEGLYR